MPGSDQWPHVLAALSAVQAGDGETADLQMAIGGPEAVRTLLALTAAVLGQLCELTGTGDPALMLEEMRRRAVDGIG